MHQSWFFPHPFVVAVDPVRRSEAHPPVCDRPDRLVSERFDAHEPLRRQVRLDNRIATLAASDVVQVILDGHQESLGAEIRDHALTRVESIETAVGFGHVVVHPPLLVQSPRATGRPARLAASKSFGSWAGVILTAPVPNSFSTNGSATIGRARPTSGRTTVLPIRER